MRTFKKNDYKNYENQGNNYETSKSYRTTYTTMSATVSPTITKEAMTAGFPARIPKIEGDITLKELLRVFQHLIACAQSTVTAYHAMNFLYLVVPAELWALYSNAAYPQAPSNGNPGTIPPYHQNNTPLQNEVIKQAFLSARKHYEEFISMNRALTERFLTLIPSEYVAGYNEVLVRDPNRIFGETLNYFYTEYGQEDELEIEENKDQMKVPWHPRDGFQLLKQRITDGCTYATFAGKPTSNNDALNMLLFVLLQTRMFARDYQEWHQQDDNEKTLANAFTWWAAKVRVMKKYDKIAGSMGRGDEYGMHTEEKQEEDGVFEDYALSMQLSNQNLQLQQQMQQQQFAIQQLQQQAMYAQGANNWNNNNYNNSNNNKNNNNNNHKRNNRNNNNNNNNNRRNNNNNNSNNNNRRPNDGRDNQKYCWSHGWCNHNGSECTNPCLGHLPHARTHVNTMGNPKNARKAEEFKRNNNNNGGQPRMPSWQNGGGQNAPRAPNWATNAAMAPGQQQTTIPNIPMHQPMQAQTPMFAPSGAMGHQQMPAPQHFANSASVNSANMGFMGNVQPCMMGGNFMGQNF